MLKIHHDGAKNLDKTYGGNGNDWTGGIINTSDNIYLIGTSQSINNGDRNDSNKGGADAWLVKTDTMGNKLWAKSYGGDSNDQFFTGIEVSKRRLLFVGYTLSSQSGDLNLPPRGGMDIWLVSTDTSGNILWEHRYGGNSTDIAWSIKRVAENEILVAGFTASHQGFEVSEQPKGYVDAFLMKIDTLGNKLWDKRYGGFESQEIRSIELTDDGEYLLIGYSNSLQGGDKTSPNYGFEDIWLLKTDKSGNLIWEKTFGGEELDDCSSIIKDRKGNYIIVGFSDSDLNGIKNVSTKGNRDIWLIGINPNGAILWQKAIGGSNYDQANIITYCGKNEYLLSGYSVSDSSGDKYENCRGGEDVWLIKIGFPDPMSLDLLQLTGTYQWGYPALRWKDISNDSTLFYVIEKSADIQQGFETIDTIPASFALEYRYEDQQKNNTRYTFYRIAARTLSGHYRYSNIIGLQTPTPLYNEFLLEITPIPFTDRIYINYTIPFSWQSEVELTVFNASGQQQYQTSLSSRDTSLSIEVTHWAKGMYHAVLRSDNSTLKHIKIYKE